jgi:hypothetical protein
MLTGRRRCTGRRGFQGESIRRRAGGACEENVRAERGWEIIAQELCQLEMVRWVGCELALGREGEGPGIAFAEEGV